MPDYWRYPVPGRTYFFTVNLLERRLDTLVQHIDHLRDQSRHRSSGEHTATRQQDTDIANLHAVFDKFGFGDPVLEQERVDQRFCEGIPGYVRGVE